MVRLKQIYENRINHHVLRRNLESAAKKNIIIIKNKCESLQTEKDLLSAKKPSTVFEHYKIQRRVSKLNATMKYYEKTFDKQWQVRMEQILNIQSTNLATLIHAGKLMRTTSEVIFINADYCSKCNQKYIFDCQKYINICRKCKVVKSVLIADEDIMNDTLVFREHIVNSVVTTQCSTTIRNGRVSLYRKFLQQFSEDSPSIPEEVFATIYLNLSSIHMLTSFRCKSVPVTDILRNNNYKEWISHSSRITMLFNGEKIPSINNDLFQRLYIRFDHVSQIVSSNVKLLPFEILTHVFLTLEKENTLAGHFLLPRSHTVLVNMLLRVKNMCESCKKIYPENWDYTHALIRT